MRLAAVLAAVESAGLSKAGIARVAGVHRSQVSRWFSGEQRPGYDPAMLLAGYLEKEDPDLAAQFTAAAGYGGPVEPSDDPVPDEVRKAIYRTLPPDRAAQIEAVVEAALRGEQLPKRRQEPREEAG